MMKNKKKQWRLLVLIGGLTVTMSASNVTAAYTASFKEKEIQPSTLKEENIYVSLAESGEVKNIYVVNGFNLAEDGMVTDYGDYENIKNLSSGEAIESNRGIQTVGTKAGKFYYQGEIVTKEIPWDISIHYYLDGNEITADDLAGMAGKLKIKVGIKKNEKVKGDFFDKYLLQIKLNLDTDLCRNLIAKEATIANNGENKQLSYMVIAGQEKEFEISADVTDFEMEPININAVLMSLKINSDEIEKEELEEKIKELQDAVIELNDGSLKLQDGVLQFQDGTKELKGKSKSLTEGMTAMDGGVSELSNGLQALDQGASNLQAGSNELVSGVSGLNEGLNTIKSAALQIKNGLTELDSRSGELVEGSKAVMSALREIEKQLGQSKTSVDEIEKFTNASADIQKAISGLSAGANMLNDELKLMDAAQLNELAKSSQSAADVMKGLSESYPELAETFQNVATVLEGDVAALKNVSGGIGSAKISVSQLANGLSDLNSEYATFHSAVIGLKGQLEVILNSMGVLKTAISQLEDQYEKNMHPGVASYTKGVSEIKQGYDQVYSGLAEAVNGVSSLFEGSNSLQSGISSFSSGVSSASQGSKGLSSGSSMLSSGAEQLFKGATTLDEGSQELEDGINTLTDGTGEFKDQTADLDQDVNDEIDEMLSRFANEDYETVSFVSSQNTNVSNVQFIMMTDSIQKEEIEEVVVKDKEPTFWERLKGLFQMD